VLHGLIIRINDAHRWCFFAKYSYLCSHIQTMLITNRRIVSSQNMAWSHIRRNRFDVSQVPNDKNNFCSQAKSQTQIECRSVVEHIEIQRELNVALLPKCQTFEYLAKSAIFSKRLLQRHYWINQRCAYSDYSCVHTRSSLVQNTVIRGSRNRSSAALEPSLHG
jgi:hypothetical protein